MSPEPETSAHHDEARYRALLDAFPEAIIIQDPDTGNFVDANAHAATLFGHPLESFSTLNMEDISVGLPPCTLAEARKWMEKAKESTQTFEWLARTRKGRLFWTEIHLQRVKLDGETRLISTIRDITESKHMASEHAARLKRAEAQNTLFMSLAEATADFSKALQTIVHFLATEMGDLCILELFDSTHHLIPVAVDQPYLDGKELLPDLQNLVFPSTLETPCPWNSASGKVLASGDPLRLTDPTGNRPLELIHEAFHPFLRRYHVHSLLCVPMRSQGQITGTILMAKGSASRSYSIEDMGMLQNLADRSALSLTNAKLFSENLAQAEALREANQELEARVQARTQELATANERLQRLSIEDALTGLANRRKFNEVMDEELRRMRRGGDVLSLILCDVDFFKRYNDNYGHAAGDECLRSVGKVMKDIFKRAGEVPARYGGEEFAVILPGVTYDHARRAAERLRLALNETAIPHAHSEAAPHVTLSIGVVTSLVDAETDASWFIEQADQCLYHAKHNGRNQVATRQYP